MSPKTARKTANLLPGGVLGNKGGSGRPPDALRELCKDLINEYDLVRRFAKVAAGEPIVPAMGAFGPIIDKKTKKQMLVPAPILAQEKAWEALMDRGYGKSVQPVESPGFDEIIALMREKYK